jgi:hypothetical protein
MVGTCLAGKRNDYPVKVTLHAALPANMWLFIDLHSSPPFP